MSEALVLQSPAGARELILLFHGVGATPDSLATLGARIAREFPDAAVVSVRGPDPSDLGGGYQWFSVRGVTEANRPERVAASLGRFVDTVRHWQQRTGVPPAATTLIGFSQGAIMALAAAQAAEPPAARVVSLSGRFPELPTRATKGVKLHFVHGDSDPVIPAAHAQQAARALEALGAPLRLDLLPGLGHGVDRRAEDLLIERLHSR